MLEHVERIRLGEVPSANGSRRRSPSSRSTPRRASRAKNGLMSMPTVARPSRGSTAARGRCRSRDRRRDRAGSRREERAQHVVADFDPAAAARRARAARRRAAPRPDTWSAPRMPRAAGGRESPARARRTRGRTPGRSAPPARRRARRGSPGSERARAAAARSSSRARRPRRTAPRAARRGAPRCNSAHRPRACAREPRAERRIVLDPPDRRPPAPADRPARTSSAFAPSCRTSRIDGRSLATIGRPAAMYSNSFSGDVNAFEIADAGFGSTSTSALPQPRRDLGRRDQPGERDRDAQSSCPRNAFTRARSGSSSCPPTISPSASGSAASASSTGPRLSTDTDVPRSRSVKAGGRRAARWSRGGRRRGRRAVATPSGTTARRGARTEAASRARRAGHR